jgi:hypothetical protein
MGSRFREDDGFLVAQRLALCSSGFGKLSLIGLGRFVPPPLTLSLSKGPSLRRDDGVVCKVAPNLSRKDENGPLATRRR